jgi:hypothetical protein
MKQPIPVTDEDVQSAWDTIYTTASYDAIAPNPRDMHDQHFLAQLRKVLENDRERVAERESLIQPPTNVDVETSRR